MTQPTQNCSERSVRQLPKNGRKERTLNAVKNHLFFPPVYLSSNSFLIVFFASSRCEGSLKVSDVTVPFKPSSSKA